MDTLLLFEDGLLLFLINCFTNKQQQLLKRRILVQKENWIVEEASLVLKYQERIKQTEL